MRKLFRSSRPICLIVAFTAFPMLLRASATAQDDNVSAESSDNEANTKDSSEQPEFEQAKYIESLEQVWKTIYDKHFDETFGGLDWKAIGDQYREKMQAAKTRPEAVEILKSLIAELKLSHFGIIPKEVYADSAGTDGSAGLSLGISPRWIEGKCIVTEIHPDNPLYEAGVRAGWELQSINGESVASDALMQADDPLIRLQILFERIALLTSKDKPKGTFVDMKDTKIEVEMTNFHEEIETVTFGNLPPFPFEVKTELDEQGVGYFYVSAFFDAPRVSKELEKLIGENPHMKGLVIDLRGNPGGIGAMGMRIANRLNTGKSASLGTMKTRDTTMNFVFQPSSKAFGGPVAVLVDGLSMSTSEITAAGLQELGRAQVFGEQTPGAALPSVVEVLPSGDRFQYAFAKFETPKGKLLEHNGVIPDHKIPVTREALLNGRDECRLAASAWVLEQFQQKQSNDSE